MSSYGLCPHLISRITTTAPIPSVNRTSTTTDTAMAADVPPVPTLEGVSDVLMVAAIHKY